MTRLALRNPIPRVTIRLLRQSIHAVAERRKSTFIDIEERFFLTSTELLHLLNHERYAGVFDQKMKDLIASADQFISAAKEDRALARSSWLARIEAATDTLATRFAEDRKWWKITEEDVHIYIEVADALQIEYAKEGYAANAVVRPHSYALAHLMAKNFKAYAKTIA